MPRTSVPGAVTVLATLSLLAGCGSSQPHTLPEAGARVPITQRAIAAIMLDHLPDNTTTRDAQYTDEFDPPGRLGAELRYSGGEGDDGDLVRVTLTPGEIDIDCPGPRCVELDTAVEDASLTLHWEDEAPEEDPGVIAVVLQRDAEYTYVLQSGQRVSDDPRELDLDITVDAMVAVAEDAWLRLETDPAAVQAGEKLDDWEGGEPDPHAYDRVANSDFGMIAAYLDFGFGGEFADFSVSPLKDEFGPGAIGGRMIRKGRSGYGPDPVVYDVLAAHDPDVWLGSDPCGAWAWECVEYPRRKGQRGPLYLLWRPAAGTDPGVVWAATRRRDQVIAIRMTGPSVPRTQHGVLAGFEWFLYKELLGESARIGVETYQQVVDRGDDFAR